MIFCLNSVVYKMNKIVNKFLLIGDKFMPEIHLKQPGFIVLVAHLLKTKKELKIYANRKYWLYLQKWSW